MTSDTEKRVQPGQQAPGSALDDSPKPHGDKLSVGKTEPVAASETGVSGDSPKRQGDKLEHAAKEAAKR